MISYYLLQWKYSDNSQWLIVILEVIGNVGRGQRTKGGKWARVEGGRGGRVNEGNGKVERGWLGLMGTVGMGNGVLGWLGCFFGWIFFSD